MLLHAMQIQHVTYNLNQYHTSLKFHVHIRFVDSIIRVSTDFVDEMSFYNSVSWWFLRMVVMVRRLLRNIRAPAAIDCVGCRKSFSLMGLSLLYEPAYSPSTPLHQRSTVYRAYVPNTT